MIFEIILIATCALFVNSFQYRNQSANSKTGTKSAVGVINGISVSGAVIMSEIEGKGSSDSNQQQLIAARIDNARMLMSELPFPVVEWPAAFAKACPYYPQGHKTERGLAVAHYRIWLDFVYFDTELIEFAKTIPKEGNMNDKTIVNEQYSIRLNDSYLFKNHIPFLDDDIIVIFEDDSDSSITDLNTTMIEELSNMNNIDLLFLGWCEGRTAKPVPLCAHSYAITRRGARKLIKYFEPCGLAVDEQFVLFAKNGWISFRRAFPYSYKNVKPTYPVPGDKTYGIFHQKKWLLGSINGH